MEHNDKKIGQTLNSFLSTKKIGQRINCLLAEQNKSQKELADFLGIDQSTVSHFVNGRRTPNINQIVRISYFFDTTADYLLGISSVPTTDKDLQFVCDYTGLDEYAIKNIKALTTEKCSEDLSFILSSHRWNDILKDVAILREMEIKISKLAVKYSDILGYELNLSTDSIKAIMLSEEKRNEPSKEKILGLFPLLLDALSEDYLIDEELQNICSQDYTELSSAYEKKAFRFFKIGTHLKDIINDLIFFDDAIRNITENYNDIIPLPKFKTTKTGADENE